MPQFQCTCGHCQGATGSIFLADMHCLPGMEGAPVLDEHGRLAGLLAQPLSHHAFDAEVLQLPPSRPVAEQAARFEGCLHNDSRMVAGGSGAVGNLCGVCLQRLAS